MFNQQLALLGDPMPGKIDDSGYTIPRPDPSIPVIPPAHDHSDSIWWKIHAVLGLVGVPLAAYHGYKRNRSVGWAIGWGVLGGLFPEFTVPVAFAQGLGKEK